LDEVEQMNTLFRNKMRGLLNDEADKTKQNLDGLKKLLDDLLGKEKKLEDALKGVQDMVGGHKTSLDKAHDGVQKAVGDLDQKEKKLADLSKELLALKSYLESGLAVEREQREVSITFLEEHCDTLEKLFTDLGNRLLNSGVKRRFSLMVTRKNLNIENGAGE